MSWRVAGAYFGAVSLGLAEPVYNYIRMDPSAAGLGLVDVLTLILIFHLGTTAMLLVARYLAGRFGTAVDVLVATATVLSLVRQAQVIYLPTRGLVNVPPMLEITIVIAVLVVVVGVFAMFRRPLSLYVFYLGLLTTLFPASLIWSHATVPHHSRQTATPKANAPAVFVFIFDEVSLNALLDSEGLIDRQAFPNFHRFSNQSVWFREATSNYGITGFSFESFLTGAQTDRPLTDINALYRPTLLSALANDGYTASFYSRAFGCSAGRIECLQYFDAGRIESVRRLVTSTMSVFIPPSLLNRYVPGVSARPKIVEGRMLADAATEPFARPGSATVFHLLISHSPYVMAPDGSASATRNYGFRASANLGGTLAQYRQQLQYLDRQFGVFLDGLDASPNRDKTVVVMTSDHGTCWTAECSGRLNVKMVDPSLVRVPMMIRAPNLAPAIRDVDYQHLDFLPTVLDALGIAAPPGIEGRSALRDWGAPRERRFFIGGGCATVAFPARRVPLEQTCVGHGATMAGSSINGIN